MKSFLNKVIACEIFGLNTNSNKNEVTRRVWFLYKGIDTKNMEAKNKNL